MLRETGGKWCAALEETAWLREHAGSRQGACALRSRNCPGGRRGLFCVSLLPGCCGFFSLCLPPRPDKIYESPGQQNDAGNPVQDEVFLHPRVACKPTVIEAPEAEDCQECRKNIGADLRHGRFFLAAVRHVAPFGKKRTGPACPTLVLGFLYFPYTLNPCHVQTVKKDEKWN